MNVLLINGNQTLQDDIGPLLSEVGVLLNAKGIMTEHFDLGNCIIRGCLECGGCESSNHCVFEDDMCNPLIEAIQRADGIILGTPVFFGGPSGALCALLDRVFFAATRNGSCFEGKPAAALAHGSVAGELEAVDYLNCYFSHARMPIVSSINWTLDLIQEDETVSMVEVKQSLTGLTDNMYALLKSKGNGK